MARRLVQPSATGTPYQRRLYRAAQRGESRQAGRGHVFREHVERRHREEITDTGTSAERQKIRAFARDANTRMRPEQHIDVEALIRRQAGDPNYRDRLLSVIERRQAILREAHPKKIVRRKVKGGVMVRRIRGTPAGYTQDFLDELASLDLPEAAGNYN